MKRILTMLVLLLTLTSLSARTSKVEPKSLVVVKTSNYRPKMVGVQLVTVGKLKNTAIVMTVIGGGFILMGSMIDNINVTALGGVMVSTAFPLNFIANRKMIKSGRSFK
tara:strand:- start:238 stop:564 length:327 start_codon:yes stop_codon:yes gene_type:complete